MAIPIECQACHRSYKIDDRLAGKKVKCRNCGALIRVGGSDESPDESLQQCLSCGKSFRRACRVCPHCGFNTYTGEREALPEEDADAALARRNRRWNRPAGSSLLALLDGAVKLILGLALLGGMAMTIVHIALSPGGFSLPALVPMLVLLAAVGVIMAPLSAFAVNVTVRKLKLAPRDDTYSRLLLCLALPFSLAMLTGWPETVRWNWIAGLGWPLAVLLVLYLLRGEVVEWLASLLAAVLAAAVSLLIIVPAVGAIDDLAGGLYADMLPGGPWRALATGHSPPPKMPIARPIVPAPATEAVGEPAGGPASSAAVVTATAREPASAPIAATAAALATAAAGPVATGPLRIASPFLARVIDDAEFADAFAVVAPPAPGDWMLTLKNLDNNVEADRWSLNPLEKKEHYSSPNFPKASPQFALSPKGDAVAVLSFLPRRHLEVYVPENKSLNRSVWLDLNANMPEGSTSAAVPALLGINDPARFFLRWDMNGQSALQNFAVSAAGALSWRSAAIGPVIDDCPCVLAPNGRLTAVLGRNLVYFAQTDGMAHPRPFPVASDADIRLLDMAFSPDSAQIAVYAAIAGLPTLTCYQVRNGEPVFTCLLSQTPLDKDIPGFPHRLLWLAGAQCCLVDGNELIDAVTGKKFASLGLASLADACAVGPSTLALTFKTAAGPHTVLATLDDGKIKAARP